MREALGDTLVEVHHIGSTSVPGLIAKPIIDMLFVFRSAGAVDVRLPVMTAHGYEARGEYGIAGRRYFVRSEAGGQRLHLHGYAAGSPHIERHIAFRDLLRTDPAVAEDYAALKRKILEPGPVSRKQYQAAKAGFILKLESVALERLRKQKTPA